MPIPLSTADAPRRLRDQIAATLRTLPGITRIDVLGSLAIDTADAFSDVDMLVVGRDATALGWSAAAAIRHVKPVLFYRMFNSDRQPAGRYWFVDESPLTRLDISFHTESDYQQLLATGQYLGHPLHTRTLHLASGPTHDDVSTQPSPLVITDDETFFGERIYRIVRAVKNHLRGQPFRYSIADCVAWLNEAIARTPGNRFAGGDGHALAAACLRLVEPLLPVESRK